MEYQTIQYLITGEIGILSLNRPAVINAINPKMRDELVHFWTEREDDKTIKVIVIRGEGDRGFCSGADLNALADMTLGTHSADELFESQFRIARIIRLMRACPQPIVAAVHGPVYGGGLSFAMASDMRVASENARLCAQYINIGLSGADMSSSYFLWRLVGWGKAAEMCLTGHPVDAEESLAIGLVNYVVPQSKLMDQAMELAQRMVTKSHASLRFTKEALNAGLNGMGLDDVIKMENRNQIALFMSNLATEKNDRQ